MPADALAVAGGLPFVAAGPQLPVSAPVPEPAPEPVPALPWGVVRRGNAPDFPARQPGGALRVAAPMRSPWLVRFGTTLFLLGIVARVMLSGLWAVGLDPFWFDQAVAFLALLLWSGRLYLRASTRALNPFCWKGNDTVGLPALAVLVGVIWMGVATVLDGDASIQNLWYVFYLAFGYVGIKLVAQGLGARLFGPRLRVDVYERGNPAAAIFLAGLSLGVGLVAGGSIRGDGLGGEETEINEWVARIVPSFYDGWWIPPLFFALGSAVLLGALLLFAAREGGSFRDRLVRDRDVPLARAAGTFAIAAGVALIPAVSGDYHGMRDGVLGFGVIALMVLTHELLKPARATEVRRLAEPLLYLALGASVHFLSPLLDRLLGIAS